MRRPHRLPSLAVALAGLLTLSAACSRGHAGATEAPGGQQGQTGQQGQPAAAGQSGLAVEDVLFPAGPAARRFHAEMAVTPAEQETGLMQRTALAADAAMLFPVLPPRHVTFWMKNTLIPLDIVFIRPGHDLTHGEIARIEAMAKPQSLDLIQSGEPVSAVLEIAGGQAAAQGLKPGDPVVLPASFGQ